MVSTNMKYLFTLPGAGKLVSILFNVFSVGLVGHAYERSAYNLFHRLIEVVPEVGMFLPDGLPNVNKEVFFLTVVGLLLLISVAFLIAFCLNEELSQTKTTKMIDIGIHVAGAILLIVAGSLVIVSANKIDHFCNSNSTATATAALAPSITADPEHFRCQYYGEKVFGGVFAIFNFFAYGFIVLTGVLRFNNVVNNEVFP